MGFLSKFEGKMEDTFEGAADKMANAPLSPVQIAKKAEKQMRRNKMVGAGKQYAPTLYTVLVNAEDDERLFGYYPTLAGETETYLAAKAAEEGLLMDGQPLVRFIVDEGLRHGKFDVVAEPVAAPLIAQLRAEEMARYGIGAAPAANRYGAPAGGYAPQPQAAPYAGGYDQPAYDDYANDQGHSDYDDYEGYDDYDDYDSYDDDQPFESQEESGWAEPPLNRGESFAGAGAAIASAAGAGAAAQGAPQTMVFPQEAPRREQPRSQQGGVALIDTTHGATFPLSSARQIIGRESTCDIVIPDINASRTHAELCFDQPGVWVLTDLGSTNGTFVNGRQITSQVLQGGERIVMGTTNLQFVIG